MRVHNTPAFVLLNRPYSETSWIVEIFSEKYGRLALIAKGARRIKSKLKGVLQPFQPVLLSWSGKGEIPTLTAAEIDQANYHLVEHELRGDGLVCGFYCNELVVNLLHRHDPHPAFYQHYEKTLLQIAKVKPAKPDSQDEFAQTLREFEQVAIRETGYEVSFTHEADGNMPIQDGSFYRFQNGRGFIASNMDHPKSIVGRIIKSVTNHPYQDSNDSALTAEELSQGKHLMRDILSQTLGYRKVVSRELFFPKAR